MLIQINFFVIGLLTCFNTNFLISEAEENKQDFSSSIVQVDTSIAKNALFNDSNIQAQTMLANFINAKEGREIKGSFPTSYIVYGDRSAGKKSWVYSLAERVQAITMYYNCQELMLMPISAAMFCLKIMFDRIFDVSFRMGQKGATVFLVLENLDLVAGRERPDIIINGVKLDNSQACFIHEIKKGLTSIFSSNNDPVTWPIKKHGEVYTFAILSDPERLHNDLKTNKTFGLSIKIENPDNKTLQKILCREAKNYRFTPGISLKNVAETMNDLPTGKVIDILNASLLKAKSQGRHEVLESDLINTTLEIKNQVNSKNGIVTSSTKEDPATGIINLGLDMTGGECPFYIKSFAPGTIKTKFEDLILPDEVKDLLNDIKIEITSPERFRKTNAKLPAGILLYGPPGVGKTFAAKALAGEANCYFLHVDSSLITSKYLGESSKNVDAIFNYAEKIVSHGYKVIVFIDEIDAIAQKRGLSFGTYDDNNTQILANLLNKLDGFGSNKERNIILFGATNRFQVIDDALLRPGRIDRKIAINLPSKAMRQKMLERLVNDFPLSPDINFENWAGKTTRCSGADLYCLLNEAAILAAKEDLTIISEAHLEKAFNVFRHGLADKTRVVTKKDLLETAIHELGHTIIHLENKYTPSFDMVTIVSHGHALGFTSGSWQNDKYSYNENEMLAEIELLLGGYVAEKLFLGNITTGCSNDLSRVKYNIDKMVDDYLMINVNLLNEKDLKLSELKESEKKRIFAISYKNCMEVILQNKISFLLLALKLLAEETMMSSELIPIWNNYKKLEDDLRKKGEEQYDNFFKKIELVIQKILDGSNECEIPNLLAN